MKSFILYGLYVYWVIIYVDEFVLYLQVLHHRIDIYNWENLVSSHVCLCDFPSIYVSKYNIVFSVIEVWWKVEFDYYLSFKHISIFISFHVLPCINVIESYFGVTSFLGTHLFIDTNVFHLVVNLGYFGLHTKSGSARQVFKRSF